MALAIAFNEEKNQLLKATRKVGFEEVIRAMRSGDLLADITHPSHKHVNQRVYVVKIQNYAYAVPYVIDLKKNELFLKTIYPSRALTRKYMKGNNHA